MAEITGQNFEIKIWCHNPHCQNLQYI